MDRTAKEHFSLHELTTPPLQGEGQDKPFRQATANTRVPGLSLSLPSRKAHTRRLFPKSLRHGTAWPLCWLSTSRRERRDRLALSQACAPRTPCLSKPPSHFTTLLLGGHLSGKHADSLRNVEPDPDVTPGFLFSWVPTMCQALCSFLCTPASMQSSINGREGIFSPLCR